MNTVSGRPRKITKAVIPAAGKGTRLLPLTKAVPKELIPLGKRPVLEYIIDELVASGITQVLFVISEDKTAIRTHFGDQADGVRFDYTFQAEQKGLADAVYCAKDWVADDPFAVVLGDSIITTDQDVLPFKRVLDIYERTNASGVIVVQKTPLDEVSRYGIVKPKRSVAPEFEIDGLVEKPKPQDAPSEYSIAGRYAFDPMIFECIERTPIGANGEYQITDSIGCMLAGGSEVWCVALGEKEVRRDIGTFETYFEAFELAIKE
ncbi:MAG: sugar phosphate nucleotidyltransferase [Armatimonadota bacterium]